MKANFGFIGSGVMAQIQVINVERNGCRVAGYDLDEKNVAAFGQKTPQKNLVGCSALEDPRHIMLTVDSEFSQALNARQSALQKVMALAAENAVPALVYFNSCRSARLPANLTQAQRDYLGAHTYRRVDREGSFHAERQ